MHAEEFESKIKELELKIRTIELDFKQLQLNKNNETSQKRSKYITPVTATIIVALLGLSGSVITNFLQKKSAIEVEKQKFQSEIYSRAQQAENPKQAAQILDFYINAGLIPGEEGKFMKYINEGEQDKVPILRERNIIPEPEIYAKKVVDGTILMKVFGEPRDELIEQLELPYKMKLAWDTTAEIEKIPVNKYAAPYFKKAFEEIKERGLEKYADKFGGTYNIRILRGRNIYSNHAWAVSIDLDPSNNRMGKDYKDWSMPMEIIEIFENNGFIWSGRIGASGMGFDISVETLNEIKNKIKQEQNTN